MHKLENPSIKASAKKSSTASTKAANPSMILSYGFACLLLVCSPLNHIAADVALTQQSDNKIQVQIDNATNKEVILALVEEFNLEVRLRDPAWAKLRQTDEFEGSLEQVFRRLLSHGNYILAYDSKGQINGISILGEGEEVVFYAPSKRPAETASRPSPTKSQLPDQPRSVAAGEPRPKPRNSPSAATNNDAAQQESNQPELNLEQPHCLLIYAQNHEGGV